MHSERTGRSHEEIIREALQRELESVSYPPAEPLWARIRAGLDRDKKERAVPLTRSLSWRRLAGAAALILLFAGGGLALSRSGLLTPQRLSYEENAELDCVDGKISEVPSTANAEAVTPPLTLPGGFALDKEGAQEFFQAGDDYAAAVYRRGDEKLIWICDCSPSPDLREFVDRISRKIGVSAETIEDTSVNICRDGMLEFTAGGRPGIAWLDQDGAQAFLILHGSPDLDLRSLISGP